MVQLPPFIHFYDDAMIYTKAPKFGSDPIVSRNGAIAGTDLCRNCADRIYVSNEKDNKNISEINFSKGFFS